MSEFKNANSEIERILREYEKDDNSQESCLNNDDLLAVMEKEYRELFPNNGMLTDSRHDDSEDDEYSYYDEEDDADGAVMVLGRDETGE